MAIWKLYPQNENQVDHIEKFFRDDQLIERKENFAFASFICESEQRPEIDLVNDNGIEVTKNENCNWDLVELHKRDGGPWVSWTFSDNMDQSARAEIQEMFDSGSYNILIVAGWQRYDNQIWFRGPLVLEEKS